MTEQTTIPTAVPADSELGQAIKALNPWQAITLGRRGSRVTTGTISIEYTHNGSHITRASAWIGPATGGRWMNLLTETWSA